MSMIRIAVVEDNKESCNQICRCIERYAKEENIRIEIKAYSDGIHIVDEFHGQYDIIFCDIQMKVMDGLETARKIREKDQNVVLIFITNLAQYAIQGYEVEAIGYLLKPFNYITFSLYMKRAVKIVQNSAVEYLVLEFKGGVKRYSLDDIYYIDYAKHYAWFHMKDGLEKALMSVKDLEIKLTGKSFSKCNSGCIVNLKYVSGIQGNLAVVNDEMIAISRSRKKQFADDLTEYLGGK